MYEEMRLQTQTQKEYLVMGTKNKQIKRHNVITKKWTELMDVTSKLGR